MTLISHLPRSDERLVGLLTLNLLDTWRGWVKRRVEAVTFPDVATQTRHISVDFELPLTIVEAALHAHASRGGHPAGVGATEQLHDVWVANAGIQFVLVPLTLMKKQGLTRFSLRDESGTALPLLTRDQTGAVATAVLVTFAEGLRQATKRAGGLPPELRAELANIATLPPIGATEVWDNLELPKDAESESCADWRRSLVSDERFMQMAFDLAQNFLLLTRVVAEPGRRRIIKISYEYHLNIPAARDRRRRARRWLGWGAHTEQIETPAVGLGRCFHLEVEAPDGIQATRARLKTWQRSVPTHNNDGAPGVPKYPDFPEVVSDGKQRVHLHVSVPASYTGRATVYLRPRPSTIVRAATITAGLTTVLLTVVAFRTSSFQANLGSAAALLLIVPGGLSAYVARPREPHVATQMLFGLRLLALSSGWWAFLAAGVLVAGRRCSDVTATGLVCEQWSGTGYVIGGLAVCALATLLVLLRTLTNTTRPPERFQ